MRICFDINNTQNGSIENSYLIDTRSCGRLYHFNSLQKLEILEEMFIGSHYRAKPHPPVNFDAIIPQSPETLEIFTPSGAILPFLAQLALATSTIPRLAEIHLCCMSRHG